MFVATVANAQVILWNGDDKEIGSDGGFWDRAEPTVIEEDGNNIMKFSLKANPGGWDQEHHNAALPVGDANFKGLRRVTFRLKMADKHNVMLQLEGKDATYNVKRIFWYDTPGKWQVMTYEFAAGPDNEKITEDGNNVLAIWPYEETADGEGKNFYIDDIKVEGPMVGDVAVRSLADNSLTGEVKVTGVIGKGTYQNTWDGDWHSENYDDYAVLCAKLAPTCTKLDVTSAGRWDEDWEAIRAKCPGIEIVTEQTNAIATVKTGSRNQDDIYTLAGQRVAHAQAKGIYVVGGKKIVRK